MEASRVVTSKSSGTALVALGGFFLMVLLLVTVKFLIKNKNSSTPIPVVVPTVAPVVPRPSPVPALGPSPVPALGPSPVPALGPSPVPALGPSPVPGPTPLNVQQRAPVREETKERFIDSLADMVVLSVPSIIASELANRADKQLLENTADKLAAKAAEEKALREAADKAAKEAADKAAAQATKEAAEKAAKETADKAAQEAAEKASKAAASKAAADAAKKTAEDAARNASRDAAARAAAAAAKKAADEAAAKAAADAAAKAAADAAKEAAEKAAEKAAAEKAAAKAAADAAKKTAEDAARKAAALGEKSALAKSLKKTQGFASRMKSIFPKLSIESQSKMGLRWAKDAKSSATSIGRMAGDSIETITRKLEAELAAQGAKNAAERASKMAAELAVKDAAAVEAAGPIGALYDAITVVGMALDYYNVGNFGRVSQTSDFLDMKETFDSNFQNVVLDCGSVPVGPTCKLDSSSPSTLPTTPPKAGTFPNFFGPLDAIQQRMSITDFLNLQTSNANTILMSSDGAALKARVIKAINTGTSDMPAIPGPITDANFLALYIAYMSEGDSTILANMTNKKMCEANGGVFFTPNQYTDPICTYKDEKSCHGVSPWPPPANDSENYTYTEWRAKNYFEKFKNGDRTTMYTTIPPGGACTVQSPALHQMCDKTETTTAGRAGNTYLRNTGECVNSREYCHIKGISYTATMQPSQMGNRGSGPLPSCYVGANQSVIENIAGSETIVRFFNSGADARLAGQIQTHIPTVSASSIHSGDPVVDAAVAGVANGLGKTVNAVTGALSDVAVAQLQSWHAQADVQFHAVADSISSVAGGNAGSVANSVSTNASKTISEAKGINDAFKKHPPDVAGGLAHVGATVGMAVATAGQAAIAPFVAGAAGAVSELRSVGSGDSANATRNIAKQANSLAHAANAADAAAARGDVGGTLSAGASVIAQSIAVGAAAVLAPVAAVGSGVVSVFSTVASNDPTAAFNSLQHQADAISHTGDNIDNAIARGDAGAALGNMATATAQTLGLAAAAVVAPIASAFAEVGAYGSGIAAHPDQSVIQAANDVANDANQLVNAFNSGNSDAAAQAFVNIAGDGLNTAATAVVGGFVDVGNALKNFFDPDERHWATGTSNCDKGYYGKCPYRLEIPVRGFPPCDGITQPNNCSCPQGTILHPSGDCQKPAWALPCNIDWPEVIGVPTLHQYCWNDNTRTPRRMNLCCAADPTWLAGVRAITAGCS